MRKLALILAVVGLMAMPVWAQNTSANILIIGPQYETDSFYEARIDQYNAVGGTSHTYYRSDDELDPNVTGTTWDLMIVDETVSSGNAADFASMAVPCINTEPWAMDDFAMATTYNKWPAENDVVITDAAHPLAAGLSGTVQVNWETDPNGDPVEELDWAVPDGFFVTGGVVAEHPQAGVHVDVPAGAATVFVYDTGDLLNDGTFPPDIRIGFFLHGAGEDSTTAEARKLFDAAVLYTGVAIPEPATLAVLGLGGLALVARRRRR
jgi:hypothetical protein